MKLIVGLGNPGSEYDNTRHNVGFKFIDYLCKKNNITLNKSKFGGLYETITINNEKIIILKPQEYMNLSGKVIKKFIDYFKINVSDILIIHDDLDTDVGKIRIRYKGSSGGHNGLKNIEENLQTNEYKRIKIGIGRETKGNSINYVLGKFSLDEEKMINNICMLAPEMINDYLKLSFDNFMNKYN